MKTRQEIIQRYRDGDYRERLNIFFMYRYSRNEFLEIENREKRQDRDNTPSLFTSLTFANSTKRFIN